MTVTPAMNRTPPPGARRTQELRRPCPPAVGKRGFRNARLAQGGLAGAL